MYSPQRVVMDAQSMSVNPTLTVLVSGLELGPCEFLSGEIYNQDVSQTLNCSVQCSWNGSRWADTGSDALSAIAPGESRPISLDIMRYRFIRVVGTSSGAGLSAIVSAELGYSTGATRSNR